MTIKRKILISVSLGLFLYSMSVIVLQFHPVGFIKSILQIKELRQTIEHSESFADAGTSKAAAGDESGTFLPELHELYERNQDLVGWLTIEDTLIDYPVMQNTTDSNYYLTHGFDNSRDINGLPFLDENCNPESDILLIHGHNMKKSGLIFAELMDYKQESFYKEHSVIQFSTLYEKGEYEIVAVILSRVYRKSDVNFKYYQVDKVKTASEFASYFEQIKMLSLYDTNVACQYGDKIIILSTCEYSVENGRLAVIARKLP